MDQTAVQSEGAGQGSTQEPVQEPVPPVPVRAKKLTEIEWQDLRLAYFNREGTFGELAARFGTTERAIQLRSSREKWRSQGNEMVEAAHLSAIRVAERRGRELGMTATRLVERTIKETERWLDRIEDLASKGISDPQDLRNMIAAWRETIGVGRQAHRLDEESANRTLIQVGVMIQSDEGSSPGEKILEGTTIDV